MQKLTIYLRGLGHITSFKNSKMICRGKLMTSPTKQKQMNAYIRDIESQLRSLFRTTADGMPTGRSLASWTASSVPLDDSVEWIVEETIRVHRCSKGQEGANIEIEQLP
jgi:hypothetical protein